MGRLKYKVEVSPNETKFVILQTAVGSYSYKSTIFENVTWSDDHLRQKCISEGKKSERDKYVHVN